MGSDTGHRSRGVRLADGRWNLFRLSTGDYVALRDRVLAITEDARLELSLVCRPDCLKLSRALVVLEKLFGPSASTFDDYKGSFCFPLLLTLGEDHKIGYVVKCHDYRGYVVYPMYRLVDGEIDPDHRWRYHDPIETEFSRAEMTKFVRYFDGYLRGLGESLEPQSVEPFYRAVDACSLLYGNDGTKFFDDEYGTEEQFVKAQAELESKLGRRPTPVADLIAKISASR